MSHIYDHLCELIQTHGLETSCEHAPRLWPDTQQTHPTYTISLSYRGSHHGKLCVNEHGRVAWVTTCDDAYIHGLPSYMMWNHDYITTHAHWFTHDTCTIKHHDMQWWVIHDVSATTGLFSRLKAWLKPSLLSLDHLVSPFLSCHAHALQQARSIEEAWAHARAGDVLAQDAALHLITLWLHSDLGWPRKVALLKTWATSPIMCKAMHMYITYMDGLQDTCHGPAPVRLTSFFESLTPEHFPWIEVCMLSSVVYRWQFDSTFTWTHQSYRRWQTMWIRGEGEHADVLARLEDALAACTLWAMEDDAPKLARHQGTWSWVDAMHQPCAPPDYSPRFVRDLVYQLEACHLHVLSVLEYAPWLSEIWMQGLQTLYESPSIHQDIMRHMSLQSDYHREHKSWILQDAQRGLFWWRHTTYVWSSAELRDYVDNVELSPQDWGLLFQRMFTVELELSCGEHLSRVVCQTIMGCDIEVWEATLHQVVYILYCTYHMHTILSQLDSVFMQLDPQSEEDKIQAWTRIRPMCQETLTDYINEQGLNGGLSTIRPGDLEIIKP